MRVLATVGALLYWFRSFEVLFGPSNGHVCRRFARLYKFHQFILTRESDFAEVLTRLNPYAFRPIIAVALDDQGFDVIKSAGFDVADDAQASDDVLVAAHVNDLHILS